MGQRATVLVQKAASVPKRAGRGSRAPETKPRAIPVDFKKLITPYKKRGRLMVRIECIPPQARFSAGRNNGDNSWSLTLDELDDLEFLPAPVFDEPVMLAIRVVAHDSTDAATLAVLDFEISPEGTTSAAQPGDAATNVKEMEQLRRLREELAEMARQLSERDTDLEEANAEAQNAQAELAQAREAWQKELDTRLSAAAAQMQEARSHSAYHAEDARAKAEQFGKELSEARKALSAREAEIAQLRADIESSEGATAIAVRKAIATAENLWKTGEAARLAAAEAQWREQSEEALARLQAAARTSSKTERGESVRLHGELATARAQLAERDGELAQSRAAIAEAAAKAEHALGSTLERAKELWKAEEAARLAKAQMQWREQSERALADMRAAAAKSDAEQNETGREVAELRKTLSERNAEFTQLQAVLLQSRAQQESALKAALAKTDENQSELDRQRKEAEELRQHLAKRDGEIEQLRATLANAEPKAEQAVRQALLKAEDIWKSGEELRMMTAGARWREQSERALAEALSATRKTDGEARGELDRLNGEIASLRKTIAERDGETAALRAALAQTGPKTKEALRAALAKAEESWKAGEAARMSQAQAQWRAQSEHALAETRAAGEKLAGEERGEREKQSGELSGLRTQLAEREGRIAQLQTALAQAGIQREHDLKDALENSKTGEASRLAAAEVQWREQLAALRGEHQAERERIRVDAATTSARQTAQHHMELQNLRAEIANYRGILTARDAELGQARAAVAAIEKRAAEDIDAARANAEREARERFQARFAEATARYETAEAALVEMRLRTGNHTSEDSARLLDEINALRSVVANREAELAQLRPMNAEDAQEPQSSFVQNNRGVIVAALIAAIVVMAGSLLYPSLIPLLPYDWQVEIYKMNGQVTTDDAPAQKTDAPVRAALPQAVVLRGVNLRADPSTKGNVIATLAPSTDVTELESRGSWTRVRVAGPPLHEGWVFNTYLKAK